MSSFDLAIVGAGTAIGVIAARLSEDAGARVLLEHYLPGTDPVAAATEIVRDGAADAVFDQLIRVDLPERTRVLFDTACVRAQSIQIYAVPESTTAACRPTSTTDRSSIWTPSRGTCPRLRGWTLKPM